MALPEEALLRMAEALARKQLQHGALGFEALLVLLDVLAAQGKFSDAREVLRGPASAAVHIPHELLRLQVRHSVH